jgi:hypothetical protein
LKGEIILSMEKGSLDGAAVEETEGGNLILKALEGVGFDIFDF